MADQLLAVAAARTLRAGQQITPPEGIYDEFCARFPYEETDDQSRAIADVLADLATGRPMDRLVCGDVGFGKTEVALRSAARHGDDRGTGGSRHPDDAALSPALQHLP